MTGHPDDGLPLHAQIANAEFRLAALRQQRETFLKQGRVIKYGFVITLALAAVIVPYLALTTQADPVPALFIGTIFIGAGAVVAWVYRKRELGHRSAPPIPGLRPLYLLWGVPGRSHQGERAAARRVAGENLIARTVSRHRAHSDAARAAL